MASVTVLFAGQEQGTFELNQPQMIAGRDPECAIRIDNLGISRQHCTIVNRGEAFLLQDLGSANGTFVNGRRVAECFLNDGDEIVIGVKYALRFKNEKQAKATAATDADVPGTLNTYVMDGTKIQEQLARMRAAAGGAAPTGAPGGAPLTAREHAKALEGAATPVDAQVAKLRTLLTVTLCAVIVLAAAVAILIMMLVAQRS
jgi:predicted component of type VI protein secretion system